MKRSTDPFLILVDSSIHPIQVKILSSLKTMIFQLPFLTDRFFAFLFCVPFTIVYDIIWN